MQQEQLERENARRAALNLEPLATIEDLDSTEPPDILLEQATSVVADMAALDAPFPPAATASPDIVSLQ